MPIQESIIESLAVKHIQNVGFTTQSKNFTQEERLVPNPHLVISKEISAEEWQTLTPAQAVALNRVEKHVVKLTADSTTGTPGNEKAFYADAVEDIENPGTGLLSGFLVVPGSSLWIVELFEDNGSGTAPDYGSPIVLGKGSTWAIDAPTGILWLESGTTLNVFTKPFWLVGYTFVGKTLDIFDEQAQSFENLLVNSSFENWAVSTIPDNWAKGTGSVIHNATPADSLFGTDSLRFTQTPGLTYFVRQYPIGFASNIGAGFVDRDITLSVYAKASGGTAQTVVLRIEDGIGSTQQVFNITSSFDRYKIIHRVSAGATFLRVFIAPEGFSVATETINLWVDGVMLSFGSASVPWRPRAIDDTYDNYMGGSLSIASILDVIGAITGASLDVGSGAISGGAIDGSSLDIGGSDATISATGAIVGTSLDTGTGAIDGGVITGTSLNLTSGGIINAGAISGVSNITMTGSIATATTISASELITGGGLNASDAGIGNAGAISGVTTIGMNGALTGVTTIGASNQISCASLVVGAGLGAISAGAITCTSLSAGSGVISTIGTGYFGVIDVTGAIAGASLNVDSGLIIGGTVRISEDFLGNTSNTSNLGSPNRRLANLYMASTINFAEDSDVEIVHNATAIASFTHLYINGRSNTGSSNNLHGGSINISAGDVATSIGGEGGSVIIRSGNSTNGPGGDMFINAGSGVTEEGITIISGKTISLNAQKYVNVDSELVVSGSLALSEFSFYAGVIPGGGFVAHRFSIGGPADIKGMVEFYVTGYWGDRYTGVSGILSSPVQIDWSPNIIYEPIATNVFHDMGITPIYTSTPWISSLPLGNNQTFDVRFHSSSRGVDLLDVRILCRFMTTVPVIYDSCITP